MKTNIQTNKKNCVRFSLSLARRRSFGKRVSTPDAIALISLKLLLPSPSIFDSSSVHFYQIDAMPLTLDFLFSFGKLSESSFFFSFPLVVIRFYRIRLHLWWCGMWLLLDGSVVAAKHSFVPIFSLFVWLKGKFLIGF